MQVSRKNGERVIPQIDFEFLGSELLDQSFNFPGELPCHGIDCVRNFGLIPFQQIAKPLFQNFDWMDCCHDYLPRFKSADLLSKGTEFEFVEFEHAATEELWFRSDNRALFATICKID
jgi:hypothetical protein